MKSRSPAVVHYFLVAIWLLFTVSLTIWWMAFGLSQINRLEALNHSSASDLVRYQQMLLWEGGTLVLSLFLGGVALLWFIYRERKEAARLRQFFAALTHEIKTPLAAVRLQSEVLRERITDPGSIEVADRIIKDADRLNLQLENSLYLAQGSKAGLKEEVSLQEAIRQLRHQWPELSIDCGNDVAFHIDSRVLSSILANVFHNAVQHGKSTEVKVLIREDTRPGFVELSLCDNGVGFSGDIRKLGDIFTRHYSGSGSGIGLYLIRELSRSTGGDAIFLPQDRGFEVRLQLPKAI